MSRVDIPVMARKTESLKAREKKRRRRGYLSQVLLTLFVIAFMAPLVWVLVTSLRPGGEVF